MKTFSLYLFGIIGTLSILYLAWGWVAVLGIDFHRYVGFGL